MRMIGHVDSDLRLPSCVSVSASLIWRWYSSSYVTGGKHPNKQQKVEQGDCIERMAENERQVYREVLSLFRLLGRFAKPGLPVSAGSKVLTGGKADSEPDKAGNRLCR